jgi:hypothetical protein
MNTGKRRNISFTIEWQIQNLTIEQSQKLQQHAAAQNK